MSKKLIPFDVASFLDTDEAVGEYLTQVLADGDSDEFVRAIGYVAKARGMSSIAQASGLGRQVCTKRCLHAPNHASTLW
jgi:probable addiction module antidote protein